jgi:hypothetical protein
MSTAFEQDQYRRSFGKPEVARSGALAENAMYIMQADSVWKEAIDELLGIRNYENNFDGEESIAPPIELVDTALRFSAQLENDLIPAPHRVSATVNQTVLFEWYFPWFYHSLEFVSPTQAEATWIPKDVTEAVIHKVHV